MSEPSPYGIEKGMINVIIETPRGCRNKYEYNPEHNLYYLKKTLPTGFSYPFDLGFVPRTMAQDGAPLDVLVILDESTFPGCLVECRPLGALTAEQTEGKKTIRNDRIIAIQKGSFLHADKKSIKDLGEQLKQIEHFFISYNKISERTFRPLEWVGPKEAMKLIEDAVE